MTEAEWLECRHPGPMLSPPHGKAGDRKLRLFVAACCRAAEGFVLPRRGQAALDAAERYADGEAGPGELARARSRAAGEAALEWYHGSARPAELPNSARAIDIPNDDSWPTVLVAAEAVGPEEAALAAESVARCVAGMERLPRPRQSEDALRAGQAGLLRCIVGNPFRPVAFDSAWRSPTAVAMALRMYDDRVFDAMPILADALQDAGCEVPAVLDHCRIPGNHYRGCWVVDLVLGKS